MLSCANRATRIYVQAAGRHVYVSTTRKDNAVVASNQRPKTNLSRLYVLLYQDPMMRWLYILRKMVGDQRPKTTKPRSIITSYCRKHGHTPGVD